jgi:hypothetical protein
MWPITWPGYLSTPLICRRLGQQARLDSMKSSWCCPYDFMTEDDIAGGFSRITIR